MENSTNGIEFDMSSFLDSATNAPPSQLSINEYISFQKHRQSLKNSDQNMEERKHYASCIYCFTCVWCLFLAIIIIGQGMHKIFLSDEIIITLITSTTINVFVFFRYVTKYLFNESKST